MRHAVALALILVAPAAAAQRSSRPPAKPTAKQALTLARVYLAGWQNTLASLIAEEDYEQQVSKYVMTSAGGSQALGPRKRRLRSDLLMLRAPADNLWLSFRDVIAVDGELVHDRKNRFDALFSGPAAMMRSTAERIADEGARFNLGRAHRTVNTPIAALAFLDPVYDGNTSWKLDTAERGEGQAVWALRFTQRKPPFTVTMPEAVRHVSTGAFTLEPHTGRIVDWELNVLAGKSRFRVRTQYGAVRSVPEGWVPLRMEDEYDMPWVEQLKGTATYSNHRLFRTGARIIVPGF